MFPFLGALKGFETFINIVQRTVLLTVAEKFENRIVYDDSVENKEARTHKACRSYSNDGRNAGRALVRTENNLAIPAMHVCKTDAAVAGPTSSMIFPGSQNDQLSRVGLQLTKAESEWLTLMKNWAIVAHKYNESSQPSPVYRLKRSLPHLRKRATAEPYLKPIR